MAFWLAPTRGQQETDWIQRFDPRFWTVDFPRPMLAAVTTTAPDALRVDATFYTQGDLAGVIWASADTIDHPLLAYETNTDYSGVTVSFHWQSGGIIPLDAANGPTLTIEGKDASGNAHVWYVRLWNYAVGTNTNATITLNFSALAGGWAIGAGDDPVYPGAITRMFISLAPPGYAWSSTAPLGGATPAPVTGWVTMTGIRCSGDNGMLRIGDIFVPPTGLGAATDYDDASAQTPARLVRALRQLGYRGSALLYVGMSHHFKLAAASGGGFAVATGSDPLAGPARVWLADFLARCGAAGLSPILSLSFEVLAQYCPAGWGQLASNGDAALTGWSPPSTLLSPANTAAMGWLRSVAGALVGLMTAAGVPVRVQIGEPWWWVMSDGRICLYDAAAKAALGGSPVVIADMRTSLTSGQLALLDAAGTLLAEATAGLTATIRAAAGAHGAEVLLLAFLPSVLDPDMPEVRRANLPVEWASPAFDRLQIEDYDWLTSSASARRQAAYAVVNGQLGYATAAQDYLAGFVANASQSDQWRAIDAGIDEALGRGGHEVFVWALPQICRDGYVRLPQHEDNDTMQAFDDVRYPLALGLDAKVAPEFSTSITITASGFERRTSVWGNALLRFDVGPGVRSEADMSTLIAFFRARRGAARGFRLTDPTDSSSHAMTATPTATDQFLGTGDGVNASFPLVKCYGEPGASGDCVQTRRITRPQAGSVLVSLNGTPATSGWTLSPGGMIAFATAPAAGVSVRAGFLFDVPVRFELDRIDIACTAFKASDVPSIPLVEIREAV